MVRQRSGFTIVELLIVVVVVAILAAITVVAYNGIQQRAQRSSVQSTSSQVSKQLEAYAATNSGIYPEPAALESTTILGTGNAANYRYETTTARDAYCISTANAATSISSANINGSQSPGDVICSRNYVLNPVFEDGLSGYSANTPGLSGTTAPSSNPSGSGLFGSRTLRYTFNGSGSAGAFGPYTNPSGLSSLETYNLSVWVRSSTTMSYRIQAERRNALGANIGTLVSQSVDTLAGQWTRLQFSVPPTPNMDRMTFAVYGSGSVSAGGFVEFDGFLLTPTQQNVSYSEDSYGLWRWDGAPNNAQSIGPARLW